VRLSARNYESIERSTQLSGALPLATCHGGRHGMKYRSAHQLLHKYDEGRMGFFK